MYRGPQQDYFESAKNAYLANGPSSGMMPGGSRPGTPGSYELARVNTNATSDMLIPSSGQPGESRENLLYGGMTTTPGSSFAGRGVQSHGNYLPPPPLPQQSGPYGQVSNPAAYESYDDLNMDYYGYDRRYSNPALANGSNVTLPPGAARPVGGGMQGGLNGTHAPSYSTSFAYPPSRGGHAAPSSIPSYSHHQQQQYTSPNPSAARYSPPLYRGQMHTPPSGSASPPSQDQPQYNQQDYGHRQNPSNSSNQDLGRYNNGGYGYR